MANHAQKKSKKLKLATLIIIILVLILGAYFIYSKIINTTETAQTMQGKTNVKELTAEEIANKLKEKNKNIGKIIIYNEETDINELLGRPNQYTSKATFEDLRIEQTNQYLDPEYFSQEEIEEPIGGTIEVFDNEKDMKKRKEYVEAISSSMSALSEYSYGEKVYLLRLNHSLTPSEAKEYEEIFYEILNNY